MNEAKRVRGERKKKKKGGEMVQMVLFYMAMCRSVYLDLFLSSYRIVRNYRYPNSEKGTPNKSPTHLLYTLNILVSYNK